jgi:hypothetical protein
LGIINIIMSSELTNEDYINILTYYKMVIPKSKRLLKKQAENIMSEKLCRCIKKVKKSDNTITEGQAIGICSKTIFNRKGLTRGKFSCRKNRTLKFRHTNK